jgi:type VI secretion system protein
MTLLDRMEAGVTDRLRYRRVRSILRNLGDVFNTRVGTAQAQPELGTPAPNELLQGDGAAIASLQRAIAATIMRYEPRLRGVRVQFDTCERGEPTLRFQVRARLAEDAAHEISFRTVVDPLGRLEVRS